MEKLDLVPNGGIRLPPGFRFLPTDEELVVHYLKRKVLACPLPASIIPEVNVCDQDPWNFPGDLKKERYFFSTREAKYTKGNRPKRVTSSGYWKAVGREKRIVDSRSNQVVGMKKTLVFYIGKPSNGPRTEWIMHEYSLVGCNSTQRKNPTQTPNFIMQMGDWVLCRVFLKKRRAENDGEIVEPCDENRVQNNGLIRPSSIDFLMLDTNVRRPSSSTSSGISEVSSTGSDHEEKDGCISSSSR